MTTPVLHNEVELSEPVLLCGPDGKLNPDAVRWSRHPLHTCNLGPSLARKKKWNYWAVTSDEFFFSATIADIERFQLGGSYLFDRATKLHLDKSVILGPGTITIPETPAGDMAIEHADMRVSLTDHGTGTRIQVEAANFVGRRLAADIVIERPEGHETLNVVIPWHDEQFQFTSKQNTLPATGYVQLDDQRWEFSAPSSFGCLDYGRGIWPEHTVWNWGAASGWQSGRLVGLNLGGQWTDGTGMTENGLCVDGRLTKISEDLVFDYDRDKPMKPWRVRTSVTDRVDLAFDPEFQRVSDAGDHSAQFVKTDQMFGTYSGRITPDDEGPLEVRDLFGWIEDHEARW